MDSEQLKDTSDCEEVKKLTSLRLLLYQLRYLVDDPVAGEEMYSDIVNLVKFVEIEVEPKLTRFTSNYVENAKRWLYMMLKYAGEDFITTVDARRQNLQPTIREDNLLHSIHSVHEEYVDIVFDPTHSLWMNKSKIVEIANKYCKIMSHVYYNLTRDIISVDGKQISNKTCFFCQVNASVLGIGRIEGMCEESDTEGLICETYTNFTINRYNNLCDHYLGDMNRFKTPWDMLLSSSGDT